MKPRAHHGRIVRPSLRLGPRLRALRAFSFPLSALPVLLAAAAVSPAGEWRLGMLGASLVAVVLLHAAGNLLNDYFDFLSGCDRALEQDVGRPGRVLVRQELKPRDVLGQAFLCLALSVPLAAYLLAESGRGLLWFGGAAALGLYAYTGPPFCLKHRALGEPLIFVVFGPLLVVGAAYAQTGKWVWPAVLVSIPVGVVTTAVLLGNNLRDIQEDTTAGIRTLACRLGADAARVAYVLGLVLPPVTAAFLGALGWIDSGALFSLLALPWAILLARKTVSVARLPDIDAQTAKYAALFFLVLWLGMVGT